MTRELFIECFIACLIGNVIHIAFKAYLADEWINNEYVMGKIKTLFIVIGFTGSYFILYFASVSKKKFQKIVDEKTDIADGKTPDDEVH
jgi:hypothetical protein